MNRFLRSRIRWAGLLVGGLASSAFAQYRIGGDGHFLDRNPELNSDGYNYGYGRPVSPLLGSNLYSTGNVRFGQSLRFDPTIRDVTDFGAPLGSDSLTGFVRDSVSVLDNRYLINRPGPMAFYDPARTAPNASYLRGQLNYARSPFAPNSGNLPGLGQAQPTALPGLLQYNGPLDPRLGQDTLNTELGLAPVAPPTEYLPEFSSSIFGFSKPRLPEQLDTSIREPEPAERSLDELLKSAFDRDGQPAEESSDLPEMSAVDRILRADARTMLAERAITLPTTPLIENGISGSLHPLDHASAAENEPAATAARPQAPNLQDMGLLPGLSVFTDLQLAMNLRGNPGADWFGDMQDAVRNDPQLAVEYQEFAAMQADEFIEKVLDAPLETFAGRAGDRFNEEMGKAEELVAAGRFRDAVSHYETAGMIDPANPLPLIGRGHALLAAGDYLSAAISLIRGIERYPEIARVRLDLIKMLGGGEVVDIRRADIMRRLERNDDPRLRFLLGYIEWHTGSPELGMENLHKAADMSEIGSILKRIPALVRGEGAPPPPKLPTQPERPNNQ